MSSHLKPSITLSRLNNSVVPRSRFLGDTGVPLPEFQGDIYKFWGTHQIFKFLPVKLNSNPEISVHFVFKFELDVDRFGSRRVVDDNEVVSAIALVLNSPANLYFFIKLTFFWTSAMKYEFSAIVVVYWTALFTSFY